jgi:hypothetical protein
MKKIFRWTAISSVVLFLGLQFVRPAKTNPAIDQTRALEQHIQMSEEVKTIQTKPDGRGTVRSHLFPGLL